MLRYFYLLSLLICINISLSYEYSSDKDSIRRSSIRNLKTDNRHQRENLQQRKHRKRRDYDSYDRDPVAEIDVASFIHSADDDSISENDPYAVRYKKLRYGRQYSNYGDLGNDISNYNEDYLNIDSESLHETSHNLNLKYPSENKVIRNKEVFDNIGHDKQDSTRNSHNNKFHKEKKCVLKNIKLPFFSHNKSMIAKGKNDKKRKYHGFRNARKGNTIYKGSNENLSERDNRDTENIMYKHDKIKKRSYIERLCPACKRKFIVSRYSNSQRKRSDILKNGYKRHENVNSNLGNDEKHLEKFNVDAGTHIPHEEATIENYWSDKRRKREDDDRNIERQKELEYIEKRVESVTVNNPTFDKIKL